MLTQRRTANALGGKTTRPCDSCLIKRARWFCAADDAFLCQACDSFVHSANQLASRHERARLETSSLKSSLTPVWHQGFTRKARTPRQHNKGAVQQPKDAQNYVNSINSLPLVPELGCEESCVDEIEEQELMYRVPVFEPFDDKELNFFLDDEHVFAADVESLLGTTLDDDSCHGIGAGLGEMQELIKDDDICIIGDNKRVKIEDDDEEVKAVIASHFDPALDSARESFSLDFDYNSSSSAMNGHEEDEMKMVIGRPVNEFEERKEEGMKRIFLKLNYEEVITAWDSQGCPWTNGTRPDHCWPDFLGNGSSETFQQPYGVAGGGQSGVRDEEREARVSRYREKRRTRLFSKKIRYEVRKLNAEKRPRMKGRFVKRTSLLGSSSFNSFPNYLM